MTNLSTLLPHPLFWYNCYKTGLPNLITRHSLTLHKAILWSTSCHKFKTYLFQKLQLCNLCLFSVIFGHFLVKNFGFGYHGNGSKNQRIKHEWFGFGWKQTSTESFVEIWDYAWKTLLHIYRELLLRAILCKYGASYIGTISRSGSDFDETCWQWYWSCKHKKSSVSSFNSNSVAMATASKDLGKKTSKNDMKNDIFTIKLL